MIKPVEASDIPDFISPKRQVIKDIQDFLSSHSDHCEVMFTQKNAYSAYATYKQIINANNFPVSVIRRKDRVFLAKKQKEDSKNEHE